MNALPTVSETYDKALRDKNKVLEEELFTLKWELLWKDGEHKKSVQLLENKLTLVQKQSSSSLEWVKT